MSDMIKTAQEETWGVALNDGIPTELRLRLARAFNKKAMTKSASVQEKALDWTTKVAFIQELHDVDPEFVKMAWRAPGWMRSAGNFVKNNWADIALTGAMFVPGLNVAAGLGRAAMLGYRGYRVARGVQAARRAKQGLTGVRALSSSVRGMGRAAKAGTHTFARAPVNPINRQIGMLGSRGTTMTGRIASPGARTWGRGAGGQGAQAWNTLSRGRKALRGGAIGLAGLDLAMAPGQARATARGQGVMRQALGGRAPGIPQAQQRGGAYRPNQYGTGAMRSIRTTSGR